eukprot:TRINITY_DN7826_c0_g2_i2.p1 TRINITY_DN7826_c0_g2~~TRINITY_DN7826_c0_g2_i2.p1  ORF type:complete len:600 (-),score=156.89 TRINITY_DN7826_c0_g2_i2:37-1836(-)
MPGKNRLKLSLSVTTNDDPTVPQSSFSPTGSGEPTFTPILSLSNPNVNNESGIIALDMGNEGLDDESESGIMEIGESGNSPYAGSQTRQINIKKSKLNKRTNLGLKINLNDGNSGDLNNSGTSRSDYDQEDADSIFDTSHSMPSGGGTGPGSYSSTSYSNASSLSSRSGVTPLMLDSRNDQSNLPKSYSLSTSGTFKQGDLTINPLGITMGGETPKTRHRRNSSASGDVLEFDLQGSKSESSNGPDSSRSHSSSLGTLSSRVTEMDDEEMNLMANMTLDDIEQLHLVGRGAGGMVKKAVHIPTQRTMALKIIPLDVSEEQARKQIISELSTLWNSSCKEIIEFYHAFYSEGNIHIALEFMDGGSLLEVLKTAGSIPENVLSQITRKVLLGLVYLHKDRHTIHRDLKPSNVLMNTKGDVKLADFGVSGQLANSLCKAKSFVGTVTYMSPERIRGQEYSYDSDMWSLGLMVIELATGRFPYPPEGEAKITGFFDLLDYIVEKPVPSLSTEDGFSSELCDFVQNCLQKDRDDRASSSELLQHEFITKHEENGDALLTEWVMNFIADRKKLEQAKMKEAKNGLESRLGKIRKKRGGSKSKKSK